MKSLLVSAKLMPLEVSLEAGSVPAHLTDVVGTHLVLDELFGGVVLPGFILAQAMPVS